MVKAKKIIGAVFIAAILLTAIILIVGICSKDDGNFEKGELSTKNNVSATQVYYDFNWWSLIWVNPYTGGDRIKHEVSEISRTNDYYKENYNLMFYCNNQSSLVQTYNESVTYTVGAKISSGFEVGIDVIKAELGSEITASRSVTTSMQINVPAYSKLEVYKFDYRKFTSQMKDVQTYQRRVLFWFVDGQKQTVNGTVRSYIAPGYEIKQFN